VTQKRKLKKLVETNGFRYLVGFFDNKEVSLPLNDPMDQLVGGPWVFFT